ncbi:hypothetical protein [Streptomyces acidiscabies]|uniref:Uncharacterized protein n=1 Tax=Streptomyces acidiscabies TaxID=42234 RepID=A0ABU4LXA7_9ACTN|nr:hypothetical protein [Streptomyces acidiscabies]MDX3019899.1 hypothetical protein [Streptomyces acidiscabies]
MPVRHFTFAELAAYNVPPEDRTDLSYEEHVIADEHVTILKYTAQRRCVFLADDGRTYAVEYEARIDTGDYEVGDGMPDDHGWHGDSVEAVEVEERSVTVVRWEPVDE